MDTPASGSTVVSVYGYPAAFFLAPAGGGGVFEPSGTASWLREVTTLLGSGSGERVLPRSGFFQGRVQSSRPLTLESSHHARLVAERMEAAQ